MYSSIYPILLTFVMFFIATSITIKDALVSRASLLGLLVASLIIFFFSKDKKRITPIFITTSAYVLFSAISTTYAYSGKFAISEFSKLLLGFCVFLIIISCSKITPKIIIWTFTSLASALAFITLESATLGLLSRKLQMDFYGGIVQNHAVFDGDRFTSFFGNANVLATILGMGLFLSIYLLKNEKDLLTKAFIGVMMINMGYVFLMAFSLGGTFSIALACLVFVLVSSDKFHNFLIILGVLVFSFIIMGITISSYVPHSSSGKVFPIILVIIFGILLAFIDERFFDSVKHKVTNKQFLIYFTSAIALGSVFILLAFNLTTKITLKQGNTIERVLYLDEGDFTLQVDADNLNNLNVEVLTRTEAEVYGNQDTVIFSGNASDIQNVTIAKDVVQVKVVLSNENSFWIKVSDFSFINENGEEDSVKLNYLLLPSNIEFRIQGLQTSYSAKTRIQYYRDSIKLFALNPIKGYGLGGFENAVQSVQEYHYETKYAHNHFFQTLVDTGIFGFALYLILIILCFIAILRNIKNELAQVLFGAMCMFVLHTCLELSMSAVEFMPFIFAFFALISIRFDSKLPELQTICKVIIISSLVIFSFFFIGNIYSNLKRVQSQETGMSANTMKFLASIDIYEKNDFILSYVMSQQGSNDSDVLLVVDEYLDLLENANSNSISLILSRYFIAEHQPTRAFDNIVKYTEYAKFDSDNWELALTTYTDALNNNFDHYQANWKTYSEQLLSLLNTIDTLNSKSKSQIVITNSTMNKVNSLIRSTDETD